MPETLAPYSIDEVIHIEHDYTSDAELQARLADIGAEFPNQATPRGIFIQNGFIYDKLGGIHITGTPVYLFTDRLSGELADLMRLHEMSHGFIETHIAPNQALPDVKWDMITERNALALLGISPDNNRNYIDKLGKQIEKVANKYQLLDIDPFEGLNLLSQDIDSERKITEILGQLDENGVYNPELPFETVMAGAVKVLTAKLKQDRIYNQFGTSSINPIYSKGQILEEVMACYLSLKASNLSHHNDRVHQQAEIVKKKTIALAEQYPDPQEVTEIIKAEGMQGFLKQQTHLLEL